MIQLHELPLSIQKYYKTAGEEIEKITANSDGSKFVVTHLHGRHIWEWKNRKWEVIHASK